MQVHIRFIYFTAVDLAASFDGAWQKRGSGRSYNSLTGIY